ncbi:PREDICTED: uncharacterized protein LOC106746216 [Dinoponera quadriceps]|uniref:Uncharacterized protein LOC106746216 n=1 Tax=Dinoponera quadriceps TaxID=609295 RepID=A0A6P3XHS2_DINQU|nr:PREDICTED: uncharacterized protein LOC106746216 [Dinoponera quadriceps]
MLSINMRIFKTVLLIAYLGASARCLPVDGGESSEPSAPSASEPTTVEPAALPGAQSDTNYYDQRQNGSENYRIHVDGVVLVFAPVEALLLAGATAAGGTTASTLPIIPQHVGTLQLDGLPQPGNLGEKPNAELQNKTEPASSKTITHRPPLRLAHLLAPFLRRTSLHPEHSVSVH